MEFLETIRSNWKIFIAGIITGFVMIAIIFALPLKTVHTETNETYYVTETRQEPYIVTEPSVTEETYEETRVFTDSYHKVVPGGIIMPLNINKPDARLVGRFENPIPGSFIIITSANRIIWEMLGSRGIIDLPIPPGQYRARFQENAMWGEDCYIYLAMKWTETQQVTKHKEITKYRKISTQVKKQKTIIKKERISIWKQIFK